MEFKLFSNHVTKNLFEMPVIALVIQSSEGGVRRASEDYAGYQMELQD